MELIRAQKNQSIINVDDNEEEDQQKIKRKNNLYKYGIWKQKLGILRALSQKSYQFRSCCIYITNNCIYLSHKRDIDSIFLSGPINEGVNI